MTIINTLILSFIEGITEFLPISSTAHLIIFSQLLKLKQTDFLKLFEVFIQSGAILSVGIIFFSYLKKNLFLLKNLIISFVPTAIISLLLYKIIKVFFFNSNQIIVISLISVGLIFIVIEKLINKNYIKLKKTLKELSFVDSFLIGVVQSLAVLPGVSRSGAVILSMIIIGYKREEAAVYSFLLAIPTIISAAFYDLYKTQSNISLTFKEWQILIIGFFGSFFFALISVKWLINYLKKNSLIIFGIYRLLLAIIILLILSP